MLITCRSLLCQFSPRWRSLLLAAPLSSVVVLAGTSRGEFLLENRGEQGDGVADTSTREFGQEPAEEQEVVEDIANTETQEVKYAAIKEENTRDLVKTEPLTGSESVEKVEGDADESPTVRLLDLIQPDFCWPMGLEAPNFHRMRWRQTNGQMIEVKGNKSLFVTLTEKCPDIPDLAAFSIEGTQVMT